MAVDIRESRKRKREIWAIVILALLLVAFLSTELILAKRNQTVPFGQSVLVFSLINVNLLILLILVFFSFRNVAKIFLEQAGVGKGTRLRKKLVLAFTLFATVPTLLLSATSGYYVYQSFEKWFSERIIGSFEKSLQVTQAYYEESNRRSEHWARTFLEQFQKNDRELLKKDDVAIYAFLNQAIHEYDIDWVEVFTGMPPRKYTAWRSGLSGDSALGLSQEELTESKSAGKSRLVTLIDGGELSRVTLTAPSTSGTDGELVVSVGSVIPLLISEKTGSISMNLEDYQKLLPIQKTVKTTFLMTLIGMVLLILFFSSWLGFYISQRLSKPLEELTDATRKLATGDFQPVQIEETFKEYKILFDAFNEMARRIHEAQQGLENANDKLVAANKALDHEKSFLEVLVKSVDFGVLAFDHTGALTISNGAVSRVLNLSAKLPNTAPEIQKSLVDLLPGFSTLLKQIFTERIFRRCQIEQNISIEGQTRTIQIIGVPLATRSQDFTGVVFIFEDLTHMQAIQRSLAWKEVAKRLAHEFKNPLTPIRLSAERLSRNPEALSRDKIEASTKSIMMSVDQLTQLVDEFSQYAKLPETQLERASMNVIIAATVEMYRSANPSVVFQLSLDPQIPEFLFDSKQIGRALSNVIKNSIEAMEKTSDARIEIQSTFNQRLGVATLVFSDNGPGISDEVAKRVFQPYFSTRSRGTGLGLAIVQRIVQDHQGDIRVQRNAPRGTRFVIDLPVRGVQATRPPSPPQAMV